MAYQDKRENFDPACERPFTAEDIGKFADCQRLSHCTCGRENVWKIVESIPNRCILHDVALVKDVGPSGWDVDTNLIRIRSRKVGAEAHFLEKPGGFMRREFEFRARVDI